MPSKAKSVDVGHTYRSLGGVSYGNGLADAGLEVLEPVRIELSGRVLTEKYQIAA